MITYITKKTITMKITTYKRPLIGIILDSETRKTQDGGYSDLPWYALRVDYANVIADNNGIPVHTGYNKNCIDDYIELFDGIIIPGGEYDIDPEFYGENKTSKTKLLNNNRTKFEITMLEKAISKGIPILGICAGQQLMNVALGGSLYQDIHEEVSTQIDHKHLGTSSKDHHLIEVNKDSMLYKITKKVKYKVNSHHHQSVKVLGKGLKASAKAPDGVIEAIELSNHPFCIGVVWHPEHQKNEEDKKLIKYFIDASIKYMISKK